jgi:hypothetical protein
VPSRLIQIDTGIDRDVDAYGVHFTNAISRALAGWHKDVAREIGKLNTKGGALTPRQSVRRVNAQMSMGISSANDSSARHLRNMAILTRGAMEGLREAGMRGELSSAQVKVLDRFYASKVKEFERMFGRMVRESQSTVYKGVASRQQVGEVISEVREQVDHVISLSRTVYESSLMEYVQLATGITADPSDVYFGSGPIDARIRKFCVRVMARVWSRARIDRMDNGQLPNTFLTRGGWNCRHVWRPVRKPELVRLADTGIVVPGAAGLMRSAIQAASKGVRRQTA